MNNDPILEEIRRGRREHAAKAEIIENLEAGLNSFREVLSQLTREGRA